MFRIDLVTTTANSSGGGLQLTTNTPAVNSGVLNIHNSVFTNNRARLSGGGIDLVGVSATNGKIAATIDQGTVIKGNVTGFNSGTAFGGGLRLDLPHPNSSALLSKVAIINNSESGAASTLQGGGGIGIARAAGPVTIEYSRIASNTAGTGSGLRKDSQAGTVTASNNWWGCSAGPAAPPCDVASLASGSGSLTTSPFLRVATTTATNPLSINQTTLVTARIQNSSGTDVPVANLDVFVNGNASALRFYSLIRSETTIVFAPAKQKGLRIEIRFSVPSSFSSVTLREACRRSWKNNSACKKLSIDKA